MDGTLSYEQVASLEAGIDGPRTGHIYQNSERSKSKRCAAAIESVAKFSLFYKILPLQYL